MHEELGAALHQVARELEAAAQAVEALVPRVEQARAELDGDDPGPAAPGFDRIEQVRRRLLMALDGEVRPDADRWCAR